jgi:hypothetical protein
MASVKVSPIQTSACLDTIELGDRSPTWHSSSLPNVCPGACYDAVRDSALARIYGCFLCHHRIVRAFRTILNASCFCFVLLPAFADLAHKLPFRSAITLSVRTPLRLFPILPRVFLAGPSLCSPLSAWECSRNARSIRSITTAAYA